jgi:hypothetical protein
MWIKETAGPLRLCILSINSVPNENRLLFEQLFEQWGDNCVYITLCLCVSRVLWHVNACKQCKIYKFMKTSKKQINLHKFKGAESGKEKFKRIFD